MENKFYSIFTNIGKAKLANSAALGQKLNISTIKIGDGGDNNGAETAPKEGDKDIVRERWEGSINGLHKHPKNDKWLVTETVIPDEIGNFYITEFGLYDEEGDLIVIGKYPKTYKPTLDEGSGTSSYIKVILEVANTEVVQLKVDPAVVLASREYVKEKIKDHSQEQNPHTQYVKFEDKASDNECLEGINDSKFITPKGVVNTLTNFFKRKKADIDDVDSGVNNEKYITPSILKFGVKTQLDVNGYVKFPLWLGGLLIQWGEGTSESNGNLKVVFPMPYPNKCFQIIGMHKGAGAALVLELDKTMTNSSVVLRTYNIDGELNKWPIKWISIGY
ncbi:phage tail protein [Zooshikella marina]|uniref:phage tail protein n=1 Tax=Zooshikella ganghwensis TaxID=202772 RepID=UPI001BB0D714|nr:phage tail protein [Zooshikella ganghwensis]MBU2706482.1 phage tail protein [Zooshikella ganghwensis]